MILGIGNDIVEVQRIHDILERYSKRFIERIFTTNEQEYCLKRKEPSLHFAGRFAAKEAIIKTMGGFWGLDWHDFEILPDEHGKPIVYPSELATSIFGPLNIMISISHCKHYATAIAIRYTPK